ncbi:MAG: T9SS type A sorting domain-containing protein [Bacteroidales bacterium]
MKKLIYLLLLLQFVFLAGAIDLLCQTTVNFDFDDNGNRISRTLEAYKASQVQFPVMENMHKDEIIEEETSLLSINLYPNPINCYLIVDIQTENSELFEYCVFDLNGNQLIKGKIQSGHNQLNVSEFKNGIYILRIKQGNIINDWKIVKYGY